ncbi:hypothetical protein [Tenacibaculum mesophilum]|uniref:hypothetical protein n=1 Tax=Tenacibaculum mesophilum TaxID=104268 RepID=UPI002492ABD0|nr:hypothetical protein [Tenacibaculum mesophilum]
MIDLLKLLNKDKKFIEKIYQNDLLNDVSFNQINNKNYIINKNEYNQAKSIKEYKGVLFIFFMKKDTGNLENSYLYVTKLEVLIFPHYYFNNELHNANDFGVINCIKILKEIAELFSFKDTTLKVINIEFGLNFLLPISYKNLFPYLSFHSRNPFYKSEDLAYSYFSKKINEGKKQNRYKTIKFYAKGLQYKEYVNINIARFECKSKESKLINQLGIYDFNKLLNYDVYVTIANRLISEFKMVLIIDYFNEMKNLTQNEKKKLQDYLNPLKFKKALEMSRNIFNRYKNEYLKLLDKTGRNIHKILLDIIIDKLEELLCADSDPLFQIIKNEGSKNYFQKIECAISDSNIIGIRTPKLCDVTGYNISNQKESSKNISILGVKNIYKNKPETFSLLQQIFLTAKYINEDLEIKSEKISHNIRNYKSNTKRKQKRLYPIDQLVLFELPTAEDKLSKIQ